MDEDDNDNRIGVTESGNECICPPPSKKKKKKDVCDVKLETCPYDPRFPNTNNTSRCYTSFIDYQRCARLLGDYPGCLYFLRCYKALCPLAWQDKWFEQMEDGTFPRKIYPSRPIIRPDPRDICGVTVDLEEPSPPPSPPC